MLAFSLPSRALLEHQSDWLSPARARLLRRVQIARRGPILDLACGYGAVTGELLRRGGGAVVALDRCLPALGEAASAAPGATFVCADARRLPLADASIQLVFSQFALLWLDAPVVVREIHRVLQHGGVWTALEPDFGGLIEHPPEIATRDLWLRAVARAGGDPHIGRKLPGLLSEVGFDVRVDLLERLTPPSPDRFVLLRGLPLEDDETRRLGQIERLDRSIAGSQIAHLPVFLITAGK